MQVALRSADGYFEINDPTHAVRQTRCDVVDPIVVGYQNRLQFALAELREVLVVITMHGANYRWLLKPVLILSNNLI